MKLTSKLLMKLSLIIDKMGIKDEIASIDKPTNEEVGKALFSLILSKLYKAEKEVYEWLAEVKGISVEEASELDLIQLFEEFKASDTYKMITSFLQSPQD